MTISSFKIARPTADYWLLYITLSAVTKWVCVKLHQGPEKYVWDGLGKISISLTSLQNLCNISRKKEGMKLNFCVYKFIYIYYHFLWVWAGMPKVLKTTSMQCLINISRKSWVIKLEFCMLINMKVFHELIILFSMGLTRHAQITQVNLWYLCDILRTNSGINLGN